MNSVIKISGFSEVAVDVNDFEYLIHKYMGNEARKWFREYAEEHELLQEEYDGLQERGQIKC